MIVVVIVVVIMFFDTLCAHKAVVVNSATPEDMAAADDEDVRESLAWGDERSSRFDEQQARERQLADLHETLGRLLHWFV